MTDILLVSWHTAAGAKRGYDAAASGVFAKGIFLILGKIGTFSETFFYIFVCSLCVRIKLHIKQKFSGHLQRLNDTIMGSGRGSAALTGQRRGGGWGGVFKRDFLLSRIFFNSRQIGTFSEPFLRVGYDIYIYDI